MSKTKNIFEKAKRTASDPQKVKGLVTNVGKKLKNYAKDSEDWQEFKKKINILVEMVKCHLSGEYNAFSLSSVLLMVFALIYFLTPTDVVPDFIPAVGFTDDATVLMLIYKKLGRDINKYLDWKEEQTSNE
ncbi:MAG: hypothetical protein Tsb0034_28600 [Ekhidna sp.]